MSSQGKISFRPDPEMMDAIRAVMNENGMTESQAVRMLIAAGVDKSAELTAGWKRQAFKEGLMKGQVHLRTKITGAIQSALSEFDG